MPSWKKRNLRSSLELAALGVDANEHEIVRIEADVDAAQVVRAFEETARRRRATRARSTPASRAAPRDSTVFEPPPRCGCFPSVRCPHPSAFRGVPARCQKRRPADRRDPAVNATTRQSGGVDVPTGRGRSACPQRAMKKPAAPPMADSRRLSVSSWRMSRARVAPIDSRTDSSFCRDATRESSRLATFAHTSRNTRRDH